MEDALKLCKQIIEPNVVFESSESVANITMKPSTASAFLAMIATAVNANSLFANVPNTDRGVSIGNKHDIVWMSDALEVSQRVQMLLHCRASN